MEKKHIQNITENEDSVTITFGKSDEYNKEGDRKVSDSKPSMVSAKSEEQKDNKEQEKNKDNNEVEEKQKAEDLSFENKSDKIATQESTKEKLFRLFGFNNKKVDEEKRTVGLAFSSEEPYDRTFGTEILSHNPSDIDFSFIASGRAPLLLNHDFEKQIGVIEKAEISEADKVGRAVVRFGKSKLADEVFRDVIDGIRSNVSVGYEILKMAKVKDDDEDEEKPTYRVNWRPLEASIVSVPADTTVGIGRSKDETLTDNNSSKERIEVINRKNTMEKGNETPKVEAPKVNVEEQIVKARKDETARIKEITALGAKHNCSDVASKAVNDGVSLAQFRGIVLDKLGDAKPLDKKDNIGLSNKESQDYSIVRAIKAMTTGNWSGAELEKEASDEISRKTGKAPRGIFIPSDIRWQRDLISGASADGGALVATNLLAGSFIEALRAKMVVKQAGALVLSGLVGDVAIPAQNAVNSASWVAENAAVTEVNPTYRQVTMAPKTLGTFTDISRHLMHQSTPAIETIVRNDIIRTLANEVDKKAIQGDGTSNTPTGILNTSGIGSVAMGTNGDQGTWAKVVETWKEVATDNADVGALAFLTSPTQVSRFMAIPKVSSSDSVMIMNDQNNLMGYKVFSTTNSPDNLTKGTASGTCSALTFGNFNDLIIGEWGSLDISVDPYTNAAKGGTRIIGLYDVDVAVRHAESFAAIKDLIA
jgi:HK97 family phage major capsid protein